jgi:hypothetical protein
MSTQIAQLSSPWILMEAARLAVTGCKRVKDSANLVSITAVPPIVLIFFAKVRSVLTYQLAASVLDVHKCSIAILIPQAHFFHTQQKLLSPTHITMAP